ncbi:MAG TPA: ABC transporter permease, partial [Opitutus sp.]|nr:ABC transporter permease [Opitutus sp.]
MKYALRSLARSPGFTAVAALTLALGIGANTTFFSVLYGVVLRGLPFPNSSELVELRHHGGPSNNDNGRISLAELHDFRDRQRSLAGLGAYDIGRTTLNLPDGAERIIQTDVTANLFSILGIPPALGRSFTTDDERAGNNNVVIVSHAFWQNHLAGSPDAIGLTLRLNGREHTVVGVMPATFFFSFGETGTALWKPLDLSAGASGARDDRSLSTLARLAPNVSLDAARGDFERVARQLQTDLPAA